MPQISEIEQVLNIIYEENPSYWPSGLTMEQFDGPQDELFLLRGDDGNPVGFVGWQVRPSQNKVIGYYSIGILPEYRNQGLGTEAVSKILEMKKDTVDEVKATIVETNKPSLALAKALGVDTIVEKAASTTFNYNRTSPDILSKAVGGVAKFVAQPFIDAKKGIGNAVNKFQYGNYKGALGSLVGGVGNAALGVAQFIPGATFVGMGARSALKVAKPLAWATQRMRTGTGLGGYVSRGINNAIPVGVSRAERLGRMEDRLLSPLLHMGAAGRFMHMMSSTTSAGGAARAAAAHRATPVARAAAAKAKGVISAPQSTALTLYKGNPAGSNGRGGFVKPMFGYAAIDTARTGDPLGMSETPRSWSMAGLDNRFNKYDPIAEMQKRPMWQQIPGINLF